ncbi:hypothetical protein MMC30_005522 [Trapelia coarctata]|nr:hypothetical protein [Trapelia coarctata]
MDKKAGTGELSCKVCGQKFQTGINYLSAAVDVYSDWIDACDAVAKEAAGKDDAPHSYPDFPGGGGRRRDSELDDRHMVGVGEDDDNDQGDYDDE